MDLTSSDQRRLADDHERKEVERLLHLYPDISIEEEAQILRFLKKAPTRQVGLLNSNLAIRTELLRFKGDHAREFSVGPKGLLIASAIVVAITLAVVWLWDIGVGR